MCVPAVDPSPFINERVFLSRKLSQIESVGFLHWLLLLLLLDVLRGWERGKVWSYRCMWLRQKTPQKKVSVTCSIVSFNGWFRNVSTWEEHFAWLQPASPCRRSSSCHLIYRLLQTRLLGSAASLQLIPQLGWPKECNLSNFIIWLFVSEEVVSCSGRVPSWGFVHTVSEVCRDIIFIINKSVSG